MRLQASVGKIWTVEMECHKKRQGLPQSKT